ncbi:MULTISPECIES: M4 family metallopeptidase [unclassified Streptomyces]|uniref:M4 family metallopeptidase n=1 Tax=unclassified Streptomyces TaxID=2593676 RepID=UPI002E33E87E|nr:MULTISPECIES: M4 family metallopeptidase [unclassified Streptomyces]WUC68171.1 M4 family metallopeptidase [Streptomyces sp. NBC_00539]
MKSTHRRHATTTATLLTAAALLTVGVQAGSASAQPEGTANAAGPKGQPVRNPGALPAQLSPSQRAELIAKAQSTVAATAKELGLGAQEKLLVHDVVKDQDGTTHTRYERTYEGLPVLGGDLVVSRTAANTTKSVTKASGAQLQGLSTSAPADAPTAASKQALDAAKAVGSKAAQADVAPRKVVWMANGVPTLAYETVIGGLQDDGTPNQLHVITDANTGAKLHQWQGIETGVGNTHYSGQVTLGTSQSGSSFTLNDAGRGGHKTYNLNHGTSGTGSLFTQSTDTWGNGANSNAATAGADAAYGAGVTWDFYKNVLGRSGIRGDGVAAYSRVHYGNAYVNAFWDDSCFCMTYGDGTANNDPLTSLDVAGHEMTHGVTAATAGLNYSGESGGLNEATSDIMGTSVEFYANNPSAPGNYLIGEQININGDGTPLRYMDKPSKDGGSADSWYSGVGNLDVHYSSGPANHWFYLASEGSGAKTVNGVSYNSPTSDGLPVTGIGRDKAQLIWYKALTSKFNSSTDYKGARDGTIAAATELYGAGSAEVTNVTNAWAAVNVGTRSNGGTPTPGNVFESTTRVAIPDSPGPAVTSSVNVTGISGNAPSTLKVGVKITHTYIGDLQIDLVAPNGTSYRLQNSSSDSTANLDKTFTVNASAVAANGTWKLKVQDKGAADVGTITDFKLTF